MILNQLQTEYAKIDKNIWVGQEILKALYGLLTAMATLDAENSFSNLKPSQPVFSDAIGSYREGNMSLFYKKGGYTRIWG